MIPLIPPKTPVSMAAKSLSCESTSPPVGCGNSQPVPTSVISFLSRVNNYPLTPEPSLDHSTSQLSLRSNCSFGKVGHALLLLHDHDQHAEYARRDIWHIDQLGQRRGRSNRRVLCHSVILDFWLCVALDFFGIFLLPPGVQSRRVSVSIPVDNIGNKDQARNSAYPCGIGPSSLPAS